MRLTSVCGPEIDTFDALVGEAAQEAHVVGQAERSGRQLRADDAVVEVVVEALRPEIDLHAGQPLGEVVDHVVALQLAVGDDVDAGHLLILDRRLAGGVVHLVEIVAAQLARAGSRSSRARATRASSSCRSRSSGGGQWRRHGRHYPSASSGSIKTWKCVGNRSRLVALSRVQDPRLRPRPIPERREVHVVAGARADRAQQRAVDPGHERAVELARAP